MGSSDEPNCSLQYWRAARSSDLRPDSGLRQGVSVQMPVTTNAVAMPDADLADSIVVAVTFRGTVFLEVTAVTPAQLSGKVKSRLIGHPGKRVYLKGDARTPYSAIVEVLAALRAAGVNASSR